MKFPAPSRHLFLCILITFLSANLTYGAELPAWFAEASAMPNAGLTENADAVWLLDHGTKIVSATGEIRSSYRGAIRILNEDGAKWAVAWINYLKNDKLDGIHAWLILPGGDIRYYDKGDFVQYEEQDGGTLYSECWVRKLDVSDAAVPGSVFVWEYARSYSDVIGQFLWRFQSEIPVLDSSVAFSLPDGWKMTATPVNRAELTSSADSLEGKIVKTGEFSWQARNMPACRKREHIEARGDNTPYVGFDLVPAVADKVRSGMEFLSSWQDVAKFEASCMDGSAEPNRAIRDRVQELTAGCATLWEKMRALGNYVQSVNYTSIGENLARGGGMQPFSAAEVFECNYGDCKDKTALLRAMLSCIDVESKAVVCLWDTCNVVDKAWPSTGHFNHCITGIMVPEEIEAPACVDHPDLGRILIFDPTNLFVPFGHIDEDLENTFFLIGDSKCTQLCEIPYEGKQTVFTLEATLEPDGTLHGNLNALCSGTAAESYRRSYTIYKSGFEKWLKGDVLKESLNGSISKWSVDDDTEQNQFTLSLDFDAPGYARCIGASMLLIKVFTYPQSLFVPEKEKDGKRAHDFIISGADKTFVSVITIPEGFEVEELPNEVDIDSDVGRFKLHTDRDGNTITVTMSLFQEKKQMPVDAFKRYRSFCKKCNKAMNPCILIRQL